MTIEKVNPIVDENGIEFYVSADGQETGMSISGLARFVGIGEHLLRNRLINKVKKAFAGRKSLELDVNEFSELPEVAAIVTLLQENGSNVDATSVRLTSPQNAVVIPSEMCEAVIYYIGFESSWEEDVTTTARKSFRRFAKYGLHKFIHKISGFIEKQDEVGLLAELRKAIGDIKALNEFATEYKTIRDKTTTFMPGCNDLLNELKNEEPQEDFELLEASEDGSMTLKAWLHNKGITLSDAKQRSLSHMVAATFKSMVKRDPTRKTAKGKDKTRYNICVYEPQHFPLLQICLNKVLES